MRSDGIDENSHSGLGSNGMIPVSQRGQKKYEVVANRRCIQRKIYRFKSAAQPCRKLDHFASGLIGKCGLRIIRIWITRNLPLLHFTQLRGWVCNQAFQNFQFPVVAQPKKPLKTFKNEETWTPKNLCPIFQKHVRGVRDGS